MLGVLKVLTMLGVLKVLTVLTVLKVLTVLGVLTVFRVLETLALRTLRTPSTVSTSRTLRTSIPVLHYTAMVEVEAGRFTVGVFQDVAWAAKGIAALVAAGLPPASLTILAKDTPDAAALLEKSLSAPGGRLDIAGIGPAILQGPMVEALQGNLRDLAKLGLAGTMRRVGFQAHDGRIFEALVARGGILVAVHSEPRAADALAVMFSYGGGNAAIGAWTGRI